MGKWEPSASCDSTVADLSLDQWVGQALGAASTCWENVAGAGVFDSTRCREICDALMEHLNKVIDGGIDGTARAASAEPTLGAATTRQMLQEIEVRAAIGRLAPQLAEVREPLRMLESAARMLRVSMPKLLLDYRTVVE